MSGKVGEKKIPNSSSYFLKFSIAGELNIKLRPTTWFSRIRKDEHLL